MQPLVIALVLGAAVLHACWNVVLRGRQDRFLSITLMSAVSAAVALPFALLVTRPDPASWGCIALSATLQIAYCLFLVRAYRHADLGQAFPVARGTAPLLVTLGAAVFAGERLGPLALVGVALVSLGIIGQAVGRGRMDPRSLAAALACGVMIAGYTVTDGIGSRLSGHPQSYTAWLFVAQGAPMPLLYMGLRGPLRIDPRSPETLKTLWAGLIAMVSYGVVVWALSLSPMGAVSALRETSILFAVVLGALFLKERMTPARAVCCACIAGGAACLSFGG